MPVNTEKAEYAVGIDVGSTTVKVVILRNDGEQVFAEYRRHNADVRETARGMLYAARPIVGDALCTFAITGSGGLSLSKYLGVEFVQEVIAVTKAIRQKAPGTDAVIELGGEDAKLIFLTNGVEQRMNGICAGGTGAFIDQMAALLQTDAAGLNEYAKRYTTLYPIAARCGVFAKSDIQPLVNDGVAREDLAASIFQAVVNQTISGLACGRRIRGHVAFLGGPLYFLSELRAAFQRTLHLKDEEVFFPEQAHLFAAGGAAIHSAGLEPTAYGDVLQRLTVSTDTLSDMHRLPPLFADEEEYRLFRERQDRYVVDRARLETYEGVCFLGVDAGSTTTKLALISDEGKLLWSFYANNRGDPIQVAKNALSDLREKLPPTARIMYSCSTGYGETLLKTAFRLNDGEVETIAHYTAARFFEPEVDSILDIGGQDMKFIRLKDASVDDIILNEACSSGCGSFLENFANSLGYSAQQFAELSLFAAEPVDLGTRCTIFMNSNVKQAQKEGVKVTDIAAGLCYSVIKNALFKVIKLTDADSLGKKIVVQGGTFYNDAVLRGFERISGREAIRPDIAGLMGAFGAALIARERWNYQMDTEADLDAMLKVTYTTKTTHCGGCQNNCRLTVNLFSDGQLHISGNRCERGLREMKRENPAPNLVEWKFHRLFDWEEYAPLAAEDAPRGEIGLPRVLNMYEDYPFWAVFFRALGFRVVLSPISDQKMFRLGMDSIPSESECYPAKLAHGHMEWLIRQGVRTVFYPCVTYERKEAYETQNNYNCPMVISYPDNLRINMEDIEAAGVRFLTPFMAFTDETVLEKRLQTIMAEEFGIPRRETAAAARKAWKALLRCRQDILEKGRQTLRWIEEHDGRGIVLAGRPYHLDPGVNHGIPEMIHGYGFAILTEDSVASIKSRDLVLRTTNQWIYHSRMYEAAKFVAGREDLDLIQLNSFGCGVDAITTEQVQEILTQAGKLYTLLKIDEVNNLGAARIRVRSLIAALNMRRKSGEFRLKPLHDYERVIYTEDMQAQGYTLLTTDMSRTHFTFFEPVFRSFGYNIVFMDNEGQNVVDMGLKYVNNDACYPALIVTGQIIDAVLSGAYDTDRLAVLMIQTGGGCRASNYIGMIRKALQNAGYGHIPVVSANLAGMESNPGFQLPTKMLLKIIQSVIYGDVFMRLVLHVRAHEDHPGDADRLFEKWSGVLCGELLEPELHMGRFIRNCEEIIREFDEIPQDAHPDRPKVGIVGEMLVKYMPLSNNHLIDMLESEGAEAVMPDLMLYMEYVFGNDPYKAEILGGSKRSAVTSRAAISFLEAVRGRIHKALDASRHFDSPFPITVMREFAQEVVQLGHQCGEGWFLPAEIISLIREGVSNIVCIQPFGCLPNHVVGKGVIKKIKELYPQANIVAVDYDPGASRVNQLNRIKLMLEIANEQKEREELQSEVS